jgi:N-acetylglucosamine malate deacetylase 2
MKIMAFFAHPDDETMLAGGILTLLALNGASLYYLIATRGEGGEAGEPPLCERAELGEVREKEMACAVQALGGGTLDFLGYRDPVVGEENQLFAYTDDAAGLKETVSEYIRRYSIEAVITHGSGGEYGHPAHIITHQAARNAVTELNAANKMRNAIRLYSVQAAFDDHPKPRLANINEPAHIVLDIQPVFERKVLAALCHRTQHALFVRRASKAAGRTLLVREVITGLESLHRVRPEFNESSEDPLFNLLQSWSRDFGNSK